MMFIYILTKFDFLFIIIGIKRQCNKRKATTVLPKTQKILTHLSEQINSRVSIEIYLLSLFPKEPV